MKKNYNKKVRKFKFLFLIVLFFLGFWGFRLIYYRDVYKPVAHRNLIDTKISQHTNRIVSKNTIEIDPNFKEISFNIEKDSFIKNQIASVVQTLKSVSESNKTLQNPESKEKGTWVWTPINYMTKDYTHSIIAGAKENKINTIYLSIDSYLDIFGLPEGSEKEIKKEKFEKTIEYFIKKANDSGIEVDAEAGWQNWAEEGNEYKGVAILSFVKDFNEKSQYKFRGFQYDVEPYLLKKFESNPKDVLKNFLGFVEKSLKFIEDTNLKYSIVVPDFYDEGDGMVPEFFYRGRSASAFKHLLNILDKKAGSTIIIMSYRNFAEGPDGSIEVSRNEINTAIKGRHKTKIIIAQETGDVPPPYITFHNTSKEHLDNEMRTIEKTFGKHPVFGGFAIHYINSFLALR